MEFQLGNQHLKQLFPFHIAFDKNFRILQFGHAVLKICPDLKESDDWALHFQIFRPRISQLSIEAIQKHAKSIFIVTVVANKASLKGQMLFLEKQDIFLFICSPMVTDVSQLAALGIELNDFALYDPTSDLLFMMNAHKKSFDETKVLGDKLAEQIKAKNVQLEIMVAARTNELKEAYEEVNSQKEELFSTLDQLEAEHQKSEKLLLNILPYDTAQELKEKGYASTKRHESVSVVFTDFKGFTEISGQMPPEEIVKNLDYCFRAFDRIVKKHGLEKIKTIGDSYMCVSGIATANQQNVHRAVDASLEIRAFIANWKAEKEAKGEKAWEVRIGIHTGPVVAGVVGEDKFAYDIWGDTVNTASRMESSGEAGKVNISDATYQILAGDARDRLVQAYQFEYRGEVEIKGKGKVGMWFVEKA